MSEIGPQGGNKSADLSWLRCSIMSPLKQSLSTDSWKALSGVCIYPVGPENKVFNKCYNFVLGVENGGTKTL